MYWGGSGPEQRWGGSLLLELLVRGGRWVIPFYNRNENTFKQLSFSNMKVSILREQLATRL